MEGVLQLPWKEQRLGVVALTWFSPTPIKLDVTRWQYMNKIGYLAQYIKNLNEYWIYIALLHIWIAPMHHLTNPGQGTSSQQPPVKQYIIQHITQRWAGKKNLIALCECQNYIVYLL